MSNGYRGLGIAALVTSLLIAFGIGAYWTGLPYPQQRYQNYQSSERDKGGATATVPNLAGSVVERTPCHNPQSESESDLCAQWRAAKAAEKSADWTLYGVIANAIGISFLLWQIILTRKAVKDTGDATKAMFEANEIARSSSRAWVFPEQIKVDVELTNIGLHEGGEAQVVIRFNMRNSGGFPATNVMARVLVEVEADEYLRWLETDTRQVGYLEAGQGFDIPPGQHISEESMCIIPSKRVCVGGSLNLLSGTILISYRISRTKKVHNTVQGFLLTGGPSPNDRILRMRAPAYMT